MLSERLVAKATKRLRLAAGEQGRRRENLALIGGMPMHITLQGYVVPSFIDGDRPAYVNAREDDVTVLAKALWLQNHGQSEVAEELLETYCARRQ